MSPHHASVLTYLDTLFDGFVDQLAKKLQPLARDLPRRFGLTSTANLPWSRAPGNPVALGLPILLLADSDRPSDTTTAHAAGLAHLLAVIGAQGIARVDAGYIAANSQVATLLQQVKRARNAALAELSPGPGAMTWGWAERQTWGAVIEQRSVFRGAMPATWQHYAAISAKKQSFWFPACLAASRAGRWRAVDRERVRTLVMGAALGLQYRKDVVDWQKSHARGAAWAVALLGESGPSVAVERRLHAARILVRMLDRSVDAFTQACTAATELGAIRLGEWASEQARETSELARSEASTPGYTARWGEQRAYDRVRTPLASGG